MVTKPGIIYGNLLTGLAGFFLAAKGHIHIGLLITTLTGVGAVIAAACVCNNYIDRTIDAKMSRTRNRAMVTGAISFSHAFYYAFVLGGTGLFLLIRFTNLLTSLLGVIAFIIYVIFYSIGKRTSVYGTLIGSISGAMPPVAGYTAVTNTFNLSALFLFSSLVIWQMPHFYAIAIYRLQDYKAAGLPVLPVKNGVFMAKMHMFFYILAFFVLQLFSLRIVHMGYIYEVTMTTLSGIWLYQSIKGFREDSILWARRMFFLSLIIITVFSVIIPIDSIVTYGLRLVW